MKRLLAILVSALCLSSLGYAATPDEKIAGAMNSSDWFALDSIHRSTPTDSINPFLEVFARCLIGNRLNRPDVSIAAFAELFNTQSANLDLHNMLNSAVMFSMDLSRVGDNNTAASMLTSILDATRQHIDSAAIKDMQRYIDQYKALSAYKLYGIAFSDDQGGKIPFRIVPVGPADKNSVLMHLEDSYINGLAADITFDTGAGVNIISDSLAKKYSLIPLEASKTVAGIGRQSGYYAIASELKIGNITLKDVPFCVFTITTNNEEADKYTDCFNIVVGSELMLQLKDMVIDFDNCEISVPENAPTRSDTPANMCFSSSMNLLTKGRINGEPMLMCIDTGDASYGFLSKTFFNRNKEYITTHAVLDTIRTAGIGGVHISQCYRVPDMTLDLGGSETTVPELTVRLQDSPLGMDYECNLGLKSLMRFGKVRFNMVDFTISTLPYKLANNAMLTNRAPAFIFTNRKSPTLLQALGYTAMGIARALAYPDLSVRPDL